jgi:ribose transport system substrate-binding protein
MTVTNRSPARGTHRVLRWTAAAVGLFVIAARGGTAPSRPIPHLVRAVLVILAEDTTSRYFEQIVRGAEQAARRANPAVQFTALSSTNDPDIQTAEIDSAIRSRTDLIVIQRTYAGDGSAAIQRARAAGIVVVAIDADVPGGTDAVVKPDEYQGGLLAGRFVARQLSGKGKVAIANGPATGPILLRVAGFRAGLRASPGITIVDDQNMVDARDARHTREHARNVMRRLLAKHPDLDAVYGVNDPIAAYCESEAIEEHRTKLMIVGMEGSPVSVAAMKSPGHLIAASPGEDPFVIADTAVTIGVDILGGHPPARLDVRVPFVELTRANVNGYRGWTH